MEGRFYLYFLGPMVIPSNEIRFLVLVLGYITSDVRECVVVLYQVYFAMKSKLGAIMRLLRQPNLGREEKRMLMRNIFAKAK